MDKLEFTPQELTEVIAKAVHYEVNHEVEQALSEIRKHTKNQWFVSTAMIVALVLIALISWDGDSLGPAFALTCWSLVFLVPMKRLARKRDVEVRARWVPLEGGEEAMAIAKRDSNGDE